MYLEAQGCSLWKNWYANSKTEQERKLSFLLRSAELILHDVEIQDLSVPKQQDPGELALATDEEEQAALSTEMLEAPYRVPPLYDISRLQSLVFAKRAECEDEIWALREDPVHFKETVWDWSEHRREQIHLEDGRRYPLLGEDVWWDMVLLMMVADKYSSFHCWDCIARHLDKLVSLKDTCGNRESNNGRMSKDYLFAVAYLEFAVDQAITRPYSQWKEGVPASPPLRNHFAIDTKTFEGYPKVPIDKEKDKFLWLLQMPLFDDVRRYGVSHVMDALEWMKTTKIQNRDRVTPLIAALFSELSLMGELRRQANLLVDRPLSITGKDGKDNNLKEKKAQLGQETANIDQMCHIFKQDLRLAPLAMPLEKFNHPSHKRRTAMTTRTMQLAEQALDAFWQYIDEHCVKHGGKTLHQLFDGTLEERQLARTPDWAEHDDARTPPKQGLLQEIALEDRMEAMLRLKQDSELRGSEDTIVTPKQKVKTRGTPVEPQLEPPVIPHQADATPAMPKIAVSKRAMKVFSTVFFDDSSGASVGDTLWSEFLHAMASAGFTSKKLEGSAWIFAPTDDSFRRSIIFHEPHPVAKIQYCIARRIGRRLNRAYGWTAETFERA